MTMSEKSAIQVSRTMMPIPRLRSPLLRSLIAFALAFSALVVPLIFRLDVSSDLALALYVAAAVATAAGVLVLFQSAAINRIRTLRMDSKRQLDEIARATFYTEQLQETLEQVSEFRRAPEPKNPIEFTTRVLQATAKRASVVFDPSSCFYLVETTAQWHIVQATSGTRRFEIEVGKRCRGDRSLDEALSGIGNYWHVAPVRIGGNRYSLVILADRQPTRAERILIDQLALALSLADGQPTRAARGTRSSTTTLRAV